MHHANDADSANDVQELQWIVKRSRRSFKELHKNVDTHVRAHLNQHREKARSIRRESRGWLLPFFVLAVIVLGMIGFFWYHLDRAESKYAGSYYR
mmetsp:Transcript_41569/g.130193  ORF Transcript_41569/g.130193 Transcript_41569/m.130193 type:complete len:95 (-) Transcript_41569:156-440(-)